MRGGDRFSGSDSEEILYGIVMEYFEDFQEADFTKLTVPVAETIITALNRGKSASWRCAGKKFAVCSRERHSSSGVDRLFVYVAWKFRGTADMGGGRSDR